MPSITSWSRIEPSLPGDDEAVARAAAARLYDPLWLLARQWQVGEFQGEDVGSPIVARWRGQAAQMGRFEAGRIPPNTRLQAGRYDPNIPLEALVERQALRMTAFSEGVEGLRFAVESGEHFLRLLKLQSTTADHREAITKAYAVLPLAEEERAGLDPDTLAFADLVAGRALDGRRLKRALGDPADPHVDPALSITPGDVAEVERACRQWLAWCQSLFCAPQAENRCWQSDRFEFAFSVSTRLDEDKFGERTLSAEQYNDGTLDWYSFDLNGEINMGTATDQPGDVITRTVIPAPVTFHGMPASRFWEFEDARINLGALQLGATDLPQLLTVEALTGYGNDWFVIPIDLPVGSLVESRSLVITDTFGIRTLIQPHGPGRKSREGFSIFSLAMRVDPGDESGVAISNLFYLPPTLARPIEGPVLEEVMLVRDELANIAWAIERRLETPLEESRETASDNVVLAPRPPGTTERPLYRLASPIPAHWIPLLPVQIEGSAEVRLARGAVLDLSGEPKRVDAEARLLAVGEQDGRLLIPEEEVPREGVVLRRAYQAARWRDGRLFVWAANRASIGRGEGSSGLAFDALEG